jgi:hypothetical protein
MPRKSKRASIALGHRALLRVLRPACAGLMSQKWQLQSGDSWVVRFELDSRE